MASANMATPESSGNLDDMSGDEFRQRQLQDPTYADVPVICMTAAHDGLQRAERLRATQFFQKPVDFDRLITAVRELARTH